MNWSLRARLLAASTVVLAAFLGVTGLVLDNAFRASADSALRDRLQNQLYALLAASDVDESGTLKIPPDLPEPRFSQLGSGLYAEVVDADGRALWQSRSMLGLRVPFPRSRGVGQRIVSPIELRNGVRLMGLTYKVSWETAGGARRYVYRVAETLTGVDTQIRKFRTSLWGWLGGAALLLLGVQALVLRWSLSPLRTVAEDLRAIETGAAHRLGGDYPKELRHLTTNLNALLESSESQMGRYRDSLGNLAHSLKTPLAVLRATLDGRDNPQNLRRVAAEQLEVMRQIVDYQLQRAATSGRALLAAPVPIRPIAEQIVRALRKVHADKSIEFRIDVMSTAAFQGDEADLTEILGNLLDNAAKWCRHAVTFHAGMSDGDSPGLEIVVEDDGPGIPESERSRVLARGARADQNVPGHGLGLAMVADTVALYRGQLALGRGSEGGLRVTLRFPLLATSRLAPTSPESLPS